MTFKDFIDEVCKIYNISIATLSDKSKISRTSIYHIMQRKDRFNTDTVSKICIAFGLEVEIRIDNKGKVKIIKITAMMGSKQVERLSSLKRSKRITGEQYKKKLISKLGRKIQR